MPEEEKKTALEKMREANEAMLARLDAADRIDLIREKLREIVCVEGCDRGIVLLSHDSPTHYDPVLECQVYDHENFSPLGDALIELYELTDFEPHTRLEP